METGARIENVGDRHNRPDACSTGSQILRSDPRVSAPRSIAEGFGRYYHREFNRFTRIAVASLLETKNHLDDGFKRGYFSDADRVRLTRLTLRAFKASVRLMRTLSTTEAPEPFPDSDQERT